MSFLLSKLGLFLITPSNALLIGTLVGGLLIWRGWWPRVGRSLVGVAMVAAAIIAFTPASNWLARPLEARFAPISVEMAAQSDAAGVILLGGGVDLRASRASGRVELNSAAERLTETLRLARARTDWPIILSGGSALIVDRGGSTEATEMASFFVDMGISSERLVVEGRSRNTFENAVETAALLPEDGDGAVYLLVTSAIHMPRAVASFRAQGIKVIAYPVDNRAWHDESFHLPQTGAALAGFDAVAREWLGLLVYRVLGRTRSVLPVTASS